MAVVVAAVALLPVSYHVINIKKYSAEFSAFSFNRGLFGPCLNWSSPSTIAVNVPLFPIPAPQIYH